MTALATSPPPLEEPCEQCGHTILRTRHGRPATLDPIPVVPLGRCGTCLGRGTRRYTGSASPYNGQIAKSSEPGDLVGQTRYFSDTCIVCKGTGLRGEPITTEHVLLDTLNGTVRRFDGDPQCWEAAHRRHECEDQR